MFNKKDKISVKIRIDHDVYFTDVNLNNLIHSVYKFEYLRIVHWENQIFVNLKYCNEES